MYTTNVCPNGACSCGDNYCQYHQILPRDGINHVLDGTKRANLINSTCKKFLTTLINCFIRKHLFLNIFTLDKRLVVRLRAALFMRLAL